jgi:hypothetical protein
LKEQKTGQMSKTKFRCLVGLKLFFLIAIWVGVILSAYSSISTDEAAAQPPDQSSHSLLFVSLVALCAAIMQIIGLIGLGMLKSWSRHLYLLGVVLTFSTSATGGQGGYASVVINILSVGYWLIAGAVIALAYTRLTWESLLRRPGT